MIASFPAAVGRCAALALLSLALTVQAGIAVWQPRQGAPAFVEPGKSVTVQVEAAADLTPDGWTATVNNDLCAWDCAVTRAAPGEIGYGSRRGWHLEIAVPAAIPPELMDLTVRHAQGGASTAVRALSVVPDLAADFYLLHLTDEHVRDERAAQSKEPANGYRTAELVRWAAPVVNVINPRFVVNSGDLTYQYESNGRAAHAADLIQRYADAKSGYRVASLAVPGNHDVPRTGADTHPAGAARWEAVLGPRTFAVRVGSLFVLGHDFHDEPLRELAQRTYAGTASDPTVRGRLIVQHFADYLARENGDAFAFRPDASLPAPTVMLIGHVHMTRVEQAAPFPVLMSVAAHRHARAGFVELRKDERGEWTCPSAATWDRDSAFALVGDHGEPRVSIRFEQPNDGTARANTAVIRNDLPQRFRDGRVRFVMQPGAYRVAGGKALASYAGRDATGRERAVVLVQVDLPPKGDAQVVIAPR